MQEKFKNISPGIYYDMPPEEYYGSDALGASRLKAFAESPLHYEKFGEMKDTPALAFGRAAHVYILEGPKVFAKQYFILPEGMHRRGKDYNALVEMNSGKVVIKQEEFDHILGMYEAIMKSEAKDLLLAEGKVEVSLFWEQEGIQCKGRLDKLVAGKDDQDLMIDYKTCVSAEEIKCFRAMKDYKYWLQEAHYGTGYTKVTRRDMEAVFIFQEKTAPYDVCLMRVSDEAAFVAYDRQVKYMERLAECIKNKDFPGRNAGKGIIEWEFPEW